MPKVADYKKLIAETPSVFGGPPLYESKGDLYIPADLARGPWFADVQHGGTIVAMLAREMERLEASTEMRITSLHVEMFRKVPMEPVQVKARIVRDGKRISALEAVMLDETGELELARAQALRIRKADGIVSKEQVPELYPEDLGPDYNGALMKADFGGDAIHYVHAFDCWSEGSDFTGSKGSSWWRLNHPLVDDEVPSSAVRIGATADLIMSANGILGSDFSYISVNPNLFISMQRELVGEWICLEAAVRIDDMGSGETDAVLYDQNGRIGRAIKSLLIDKK